MDDIYNPHLDPSESEGDIYDEESFGSRVSESDDSITDSIRMPPPPSKSKLEMELRKLTKDELLEKYLTLKATEDELRNYNREIILENRRLHENIEDMSKQSAIIDVLKMGKERIEKEKADLTVMNAVLRKRVAKLESKLPSQGGRTRRK